MGNIVDEFMSENHKEMKSVFCTNSKTETFLIKKLSIFYYKNHFFSVELCSVEESAQTWIAFAKKSKETFNQSYKVDIETHQESFPSFFPPTQSLKKHIE